MAFSGGVDSAVLLHACHRALGARAVGVIADSASLPRADLERAKTFARDQDIALEVVTTAELKDPRYRVNTAERCYFCKEALFDGMELVAKRHDLATLAFGAIVDDAFDERPGARSATERGVRAPLAEAGFTKADVRAYARTHELPMWDTPASACLASRIPHGTVVTAERLARIEEAEASVRALGFRVLRVRDHGQKARVEVGEEERARAGDMHRELAACLKPAGFLEVELATYGRQAK